MYPSAALPHFRPRFVYIFGHYGHVWSLKVGASLPRRRSPSVVYYYEGLESACPPHSRIGHTLDFEVRSKEGRNARGAGTVGGRSKKYYVKTVSDFQPIGN